MPHYDFKTLSPIDFENLVRDLLQRELGVTLESFTSGRDQGIDFRYCQGEDSELVVQAKHYAESGFRKLSGDLQNMELPKVRELYPNRYVLATSVGLTPLQKDAIASIFSPFMRGTSDFLGREDLNNLLTKFPEIERHTLKLWLFSLPILQEVLHSAVKNMAAFELEGIRSRAKLYVQNESFQKAVDILDRYNFCVIAGPPGIGKTTLAEMLILHYYRAGYEIIKVSQDVSEAWSLKTPDKSQIFYYDDFLGQTSASEKMLKNEDQRLLDFISAVRNSTGIKLILTTREYILKQAYQRYEKLERYGFDAQKCVVDLEEYTRHNRAQILYNHLYFASLPRPFIREILQGSRYLRIIDHPNYNPRIVQLMTSQAFLGDVETSNYFQHFMANLTSPLRVWQHAFENHLSQRARNVLVVLASLPQRIFVDDLEHAFENYNSAYSGFYHTDSAPQDFRRALKEVEGDFLSSQASSGNIVISFMNHSARDFVEQYLRLSSPEVGLLASSLAFFDQLQILWHGPFNALARQRLRELDRESGSAFQTSIDRCIDGPTCNLVNFWSSGVVRVDRHAPPMEAKAVLLLEMYLEGFEGVIDLLVRLTEGILHRIERDDCDRSELATMIGSLATSHLATAAPFNSVIETGKRLLLTKGYCADQFWPLCHLLEKVPELFSEEDRAAARVALRDTAEEVTSDAYGDDSERLREEAADFEAISAKIGADLSKEIRHIQSMADECESESGRNDAPIEYKKEVWSGHGSNEEIASLFSTLAEGDPLDAPDSWAPDGL